MSQTRGQSSPRTLLQFIVVVLFASLAGSPRISLAGDWPAFRGPDGSNISADAAPPVRWSDSQNIRWKTPLPGPGSSSPIVFGDRVFVTCYSGYGDSPTNIDDIRQLKRHLLCVNRENGKVIWSKTIAAEMPEDEYRGYITEHGYASSTPATDGQRIYAFFGKSGVLAFDFDGNQLWRTSVGKESANRLWGSAASPILYKDTVIVNASEESRAIIALNKETGDVVWKAEGASLELTYGTPALVDLPDAGKELVIAVPNEVWGLNPDTGKLNWYALMEPNGNICPSPVTADGIVYAFGGFRRKGSVAIRAGGRDDVTNSHVIWTSDLTSYVPTPLLHNGHLYWVDEQATAHCVDAATGKAVYRRRLDIQGRGQLVYASAVLADGRLYVVSRSNGTFVLAAQPQFELISHNRIDADDSDFNASPAVSDDNLFLRSNRFVYCIARKGGT